MSTNYPSAPSQNQSNGLGIAGFIVSLLGIIGTCGLLSPVGLVMSIIAMKREPKGFAIAGLVLGIIGSLSVLIGVILIGLFGVAAVLAAIGISAAAPPIHATAEMVRLTHTVAQYRTDHGSLPAAVSQLPGLSHDQITDPWGNAYLIVPDTSPDGFSIVSVGPDGQPSTGDEITYSKD